MKKAEKLKLAIDAIDERLCGLNLCATNATCPLCIRLNVKCEICPARSAEIYPCGEYIDHLHACMHNLRQQKVLWAKQLEKLEGKKQ